MSKWICWNKMPARCNRWFLLLILLLAQHVSAHHYAHHQELESIKQVVAACGIWCFGFQVVGMVWRVIPLLSLRAFVACEVLKPTHSCTFNPVQSKLYVPSASYMSSCLINSLFLYQKVLLKCYFIFYKSFSSYRCIYLWCIKSQKFSDVQGNVKYICTFRSAC